MHECVEDGASADHHLVVRRIDGELFRPQSFQRGNITRQRGDPFLVVERAYVLFIGTTILHHGDHSPGPTTSRRSATQVLIRCSMTRESS